MKRFLLALLLASGVTYADTTENLVTSPLTPTVPATAPGGYSGGSSAGYNSSTNTYYFGYTSQQVGQTWAINQALSSVGAGIQINGFSYGFSYLNGGDSYGSLVSHAYMTDAAGNINLQEAINWSQDPNWQTINRTVTYGTAQELANVGSGGLYFTGRDSRFWAGYYGPQVKDPYYKVNYTVDQCAVNPQSSPTCPGFKTYYNMWDDGYAQVNLPFAFPFYGQLFTTSYMYTNGVVGFLNNNWGFCCDGTDLNGQVTQPNSPWNYAIYALNTDLIPGPNSEFYTQVTDGGTGLKYSWVNVPEIGTSLNNTFHVQIKNSGYIGITYDQVNLNSWRNPLIGIAGDISKGEYVQTYYGAASGLPNLAGVTNVYTGTEITDICSVNPLLSTSCPGYASAYLTQQCSFNALYDPSCPGYATAYYDYQCSANPLYHTGCTGYAQAFFDQQCSLDSLYNSQCPGYAQAYFDQQCSLDDLYSQSCPNYADAYYVQQCTISPLYDSGCTGYAQAYFDQQCSLDGLYNNQCPNYAEAYAKKNILSIGTTPTTTTVAIVETTVATPTVSSDGTVKTEVSKTGDSTIDSLISTTTTSTTSATATVQLAPSPTQSSPAQTVGAVVAERKQEEKQETKNDSSSSTKENSSGSSNTQTAKSGTEQKDQPKSTRQALAEKRLEAAKAKAVEEGKQLANKMGDAASMEQQVAVQNVVIAAMGFTPGFQTYNVIMPDVPGYKPFTVYKNQKNVDNARMMRGLSGASDRLHEDMVASQYTQR
jgi:hypothetical protein